MHTGRVFVCACVVWVGVGKMFGWWVGGRGGGKGGVEKKHSRSYCQFKLDRLERKGEDAHPL